jgi:streptogramin lyase
MRIGWISVLLAFTALGSPAKDWTVANLAGTGAPRGPDPLNPPGAITDPYGLVRGPDGAIWFCEHNGHRISRLAPDGTVTVIAGTGAKGYSGDGGPAVAATLNLPHELRFGPDGALYVADTGNNVVRRIDPGTGLISTFAGTGARGYSGDGGPAGLATFRGPHSIQFDSAGQLYVCDVGNHVVRRIDPRTGIITTIAGTGKPGPTPDGAPLAGTPFNNPRSLDVDADGNPWLVTREGNQVFKLDLKAGVVRLVAGTGQAGFTGNGGPALAATLSGPKGIALDRTGNAWLVDTESHSIRMIDSATGRLELVLGTGSPGDGPLGQANACALNRPHGVFIDADGSVLVGDSEAHRIRALRPE